MTNIAPFILPFSKISARDLGLVGGKGANLGEMVAAAFPVPNGFCVTTKAFEKFIDAAPNADVLYKELESITPDDLDSVREIGERVRKTLLEVPICNQIAEAVRQSWQEIDANAAYAVRSSATAEDLPDASFAGQQDTYLNVIGEEALLDAMRRCWVSLFTDRAILYRVQNGFDHRDVQLSVVVQKMIMSEKSGTLFTADPLTGHRHTLTIDASFGLGEALVSGLVTPDAYKVDKRTMTIIERQVSEKEVVILPEKDGGTRQVALDADKRKQAALTNDQILKLTELGVKIESHYGSPQDIEWAISSGELYLLQTRPITSLYPIDGLQSPDDSLHVFYSGGHQQNMTSAMPPLSLSTFPNFIPIALRADDGTVPILRFSGGRFFVDVTEILRHPLGKRGFPKAISQFDLLAPQLFQLVTRRPEFKRRHRLRFSPKVIKGLFGIFHRLFKGLWRRDLQAFVAQTNLLIDDFIADSERRLREIPKGKTQIEAMLSALETPAPFFMNWVPEAAAGIAATRLLPKLASRWLLPEKVEALTLGISGNVVNEMNLMLSDLAEFARKSPKLVAAFDHLRDDAHLWLEEVAGIEGSASFLKGWQDFLMLYGSRASSEIDLSMKRWHEDPLPVLRVIAGNIEKNVSSRALFEEQVREREAAYVELLAAVSNGLKLRLIKRLYHVLVEAGGMREHHKFMMVRFLDVIRELLKENAGMLVASGKLSSLDDIWFLRWDELLDIWDDDESMWHEIVEERRADFARYLKLSAPAVITSDGEMPVAQYHVDDAPVNALLGNPVSPGIVEGVAHVIHDPTTETLEPGEILVAPFTDPGWTPLFINAAGLVMDIGGALAHGSVVAREYGIPAVVGVRESTQKIKTGQRVRVDGNRGIVEVL